MPIYSGEWEDDAGHPFDPTSVSYPNNKQGRRCAARRQFLSQTTAQKAVVGAFLDCSWLWRTKVDANERTAWTYNGQVTTWHCRDGIRKSLGGFAMFVRSILTQVLYQEEYLIHPHLVYEPPWCELTHAYWSPSTQKVFLTFTNPVPTIDYKYSSLSVYQLNPALPCYFNLPSDPPNGTRAAPYSSRRIGQVSPWPTSAPALWNGSLAWPATPGVNMYLYARWHEDYTFAGNCFAVPFGAPPPDGYITGTLDPDITGGWAEDGLWDGQMSYARIDGGWWLWYFPNWNMYFISSVKGATPEPFWGKYGSTDPEGNYDPNDPPMGVATFTLA